MNEIGKIVLTPAETAKVIGISQNTIREWCKEKTKGFPSFKVGRDYKIPLDSLEKWVIKQGEIGSELK